MSQSVSTGLQSEPRASSPELLPDSPDTSDTLVPQLPTQPDSETWTPPNNIDETSRESVVYESERELVVYEPDSRESIVYEADNREPVVDEAERDLVVSRAESSDSAVYGTQNSESAVYGVESVDTIAPWSRQDEPNNVLENLGWSNIAEPSELRSPVEIAQASSVPENRPPSVSRVDDNTSDSARSEAIEVSNEESNSESVDAKDCEEPPAKIRKIDSPPKNDETDGETCPICLDSWGNSGDHRLVALKCGHLFGSQCVQRWLKAQTPRDRSCPTCKSKANIKDLRFIYARRLVAADTSQITSLQLQVLSLQAEKSRTELELQKTKIAHRACSMQLEGLRSLMKSQANKEQPVRKSWRFALEKNLEISKDGGCRVLTYNYRTYELYVSQKSGNYLFPGYGIRKISCLDYKLGQFVHLHPKPIRDITYSQPRDLLLSVGLDSSARIVERGIPSVTVNTGMPLWSCSWDYLRSNEFYVGGVGGVIHQYDVRYPSNYIQMLSTPSDMSPVVSLCSTEFGLLTCQLNSSWLWVGNNRQWEPRSLPVEGSFMSLCYDNESHRALLSCRPSANGLEKSKLTLCKLKSSVSTGEVLFDVEETFNGSARSSVMSRASWVKVPGASWVAAHSESDSTLYLHGLDGARTMSLPAAEPALDVSCVELNGNTILAALSESRLRIYKGVPTNS